MSSSLLLDVMTAAAADESVIEKQTFTGETITDFDGRHLDFDSVHFEKCRFVHCDFSNASFRQVTLQGCDFSNCAFKESFWKECCVIHCKANGADFENATLRQTQISDTLCRYISLTRALLDRCTLTDCDLRESAFSEVKLKQSSFHNIDFSQGDFFKTSLKNVDLSSCCIEGMLVSDTFNELKGMKISPEQAPFIASLHGIIVKY